MSAYVVVGSVRCTDQPSIDRLSRTGDSYQIVGDDVGMSEQPRLRYRLLTGPDDRSFCEKISAALDQGYVLHGSPSVGFDGVQLIAAQAVVLPAPTSGSVQWA